MKRHIFNLFLVLGIIMACFNVDKRVEAYYNNAKDQLTRIQINTLSSHAISFTLSNSEKIEVGYNMDLNFKKDGAGFEVDGAGTTVNDFDFNDGVERSIVATDGSCTGFNGVNDIAVSVNESLDMVTFTPCPSFAASSPNASVVIKYGISATVGGLGHNRVTNPLLPGSYYINIGHNGQKITNTAVIIITDDSISVSGTVDPFITILISTDRSLGFGDVATTNVRYATANSQGSASEPPSGQPIGISAGTNGQGGITLYMYDTGDGANAGLWSGGLNELIPSGPAHLVTNNSKSYAVYAKNSTGLTINPLFDNDGGNGEGQITTTPQILVSNANPFASGSFDLTLKAATNSTTRAGVYSDIITLMCTAIY